MLIRRSRSTLFATGGEKPDAITVVPNSPEALEEVLKQARGGGNKGGDTRGERLPLWRLGTRVLLTWHPDGPLMRTRVRGTSLWRSTRPDRCHSPIAATAPCCAPERSGQSCRSGPLATSRHTRRPIRQSRHRRDTSRDPPVGFHHDRDAHAVAVAGSKTDLPSMRAVRRWSDVSWFEAIMAHVSGRSSRTPSTSPPPRKIRAKAR